MEKIALESGEHIVDEIRMHWFVLFLELLPYLVLAFLPFVIEPVINLAASTTPAFLQIKIILANITSQHWIRLVLGLWWLFVWIGAFNTLTRYFLNVWILTTERIIEIRQPHYFSRRVSSFFLSRIQDVTSDIEGVLGTFLDFGFIHVETAGENEAFEMHGIRHPRNLRNMILREIDEVHRNHSSGGGDGL